MAGKSKSNVAINYLAIVYKNVFHIEKGQVYAVCLNVLTKYIQLWVVCEIRFGLSFRTECLFLDRLFKIKINFV